MRVSSLIWFLERCLMWFFERFYHDSISLYMRVMDSSVSSFLSYPCQRTLYSVVFAFPSSTWLWKSSPIPTICEGENDRPSVWRSPSCEVNTGRREGDKEINHMDTRTNTRRQLYCLAASSNPSKEKKKYLFSSVFAADGIRDVETLNPNQAISMPSTVLL